VARHNIAEMATNKTYESPAMTQNLAILFLKYKPPAKHDVLF